MSLGSAIDNNLAILLLGFSMTGGLAYGAYRLFKDNPRPAIHLIKMKKKVLLDKEEDVDDWKKSWQKYLEKHTKTETIEATTPISPTLKAKTPQNTTKKVLLEEDSWKLKDWETIIKGDTTKVPESFKDECFERSTKKFLGTWADDYLEFEKYCTKDAEEE